MSASLRKPARNKPEKKRIVCVDENAPKRPRSAYVHFVNARRKELVDSGTHGGVHQRSFLAEIGKQWKILPEDQKKLYFEKSAEEHEDYQKAMEEYKKTESYNQFQAKKEGLRKQRMLELKRRKSDMSVEDTEENKSDAVIVGDIPIFSKEFLAYNKSQETRCKKLRKMASALQEEKELLKADIAKLSEKVKMLNGQQSGSVQLSTKIKQQWTKLLVDALAYVSVDGLHPTSQNIDTYMKKLKHLVAESPSSKDLIAVRMALSEVNFT